ncbi:MAG: archease [Thermoguttaceae bacterium]|jgi:SHS2 domain-containing protein
MYETFEHTADLGLRIRADDLNSLFAEAGRALFSVIVEKPEDIRTIEEIPFTINVNDVEELLHDWLTELLFTFHVRRLLLVKFDVNIQASGLTAIAQGEKIDLKRHEINLEIKAITWHGLKVVQSPTGWLAEVIVDI